MNKLQIKKEDLIHNINVIKDEVNNEEYTIIGVVKGDGYGLGLKEYSNLLIENGITMLAVATVGEAIKLRNINKEIDILNMSSTSIEEEIQKLVENNIILTIGSKECAQIINKIAKEGKNIRAHIKVDTGFGRYGFVAKEEVAETIKSLDENVKVEGIFSHFSLAYYKNNKSTINQYNKFLDVLNFLEEQNIKIKLTHICNSPAFINYPEMRLNSARIGSAFLGRVDSFKKLDLKKIGVLKSNVSEIKTLPPKFNVGYLNTYTTKKEIKVAIIPIGYKDGFNMNTKNDMFRFVDKLRSLKHNVQNLFTKEELFVNIAGKNYPIIGKIGMFHITVNITNSHINTNDEVLLNVNPIHVDSLVEREYV